MPLDLTILYRGPLSSCNYDCDYCPFAKKHETAAELAVDRSCLKRFREWIFQRASDRFAILFTPWGEALTRRWYRETIEALSHQENVRRVAIQTNLSCDLDWLSDCNRQTVGLWCTWHPSQISLAEFVEQCRKLESAKVRFSVGMVGLKEYQPLAVQLRNELPSQTYFWVNAYKDVENYYTAEQVAEWVRLDPLFEFNNQRHESFGHECRAGQSVVSIDGDGTLRRCHFIKHPIGNIYQVGWEQALQPRKCTNQTCGCHIGYVHLNRLNLYEVFGNGVLERIPEFQKQAQTS